MNAFCRLFPASCYPELISPLLKFIGLQARCLGQISIPKGIFTPILLKFEAFLATFLSFSGAFHDAFKSTIRTKQMG